MNLLHVFVGATSLSLVLAGISAQAEDKKQEQKIACSKLPDAVRSGLSKEFPKATIKSCSKEIENQQVSYELVTFEGKTRRDVMFSPEGKLVFLEEVVPFESVPEPVRDAILRAHPRKDVTLTEKTTRDGTVLYEFQVRARAKRVQLVFDPNGKEVKP
jgi:hypothetical protein